nr:MAG TPA_asm: hypothetical protein [Caudoviricetes sp.]
MIRGHVSRRIDMIRDDRRRAGFRTTPVPRQP